MNTEITLPLWHLIIINIALMLVAVGFFNVIGEYFDERAKKMKEKKEKEGAEQ